MTYLLDSDWVIDWLGHKPAALELLALLADAGIAISLMTYEEVYEGIIWGRHREVGEVIFFDFLSSAEILPINRAIMRQFARIRGELRRRGQMIRDPDILVAATAIEHDLTLVTRNRAHFGRIPHLRIYTDS